MAWKKAQREIAAYLARNPHDDLSAAEVAARCGISPASAAKCLSLMAGEGVLKRISVYQLAQRPGAPGQRDPAQPGETANDAPGLCTPDAARSSAPDAQPAFPAA